MNSFFAAISDDDNLEVSVDSPTPVEKMKTQVPPEKK